MRVVSLRWLGVPTREYAQMARFLRDVMGLEVNFEEATTIEFSLPSGDEIQLFAPGDPYYEFFQANAAGHPVTLFEVDDVHGAQAELRAAGIEIVDPLGRDTNWEWIHFRAPDGNLYELASWRRDHASDAAG